MTPSWLRKRKDIVAPAAAPAEEASPPSKPLRKDERIYAIGDIHGRFDLLDAMQRLIWEDLHAQPIGAAEIVYLGDYIDRGPDSASVIDCLANPPVQLPSATHLLGNHEAVFVGFLAAAMGGGTFREFGGKETLRSYGVDPDVEAAHGWSKAMREGMASAMPERHRAFLEGLLLVYDRPPYFFCHAGVKPGVPLDKQSESALIWIRDEFLNSSADFGRVVVHGHTPVASPQVRYNRINVDTGAYKTGRLTCAVLEIGNVRFLQTPAE